MVRVVPRLRVTTMNRVRRPPREERWDFLERKYLARDRLANLVGGESDLGCVELELRRGGWGRA